MKRVLALDLEGTLVSNAVSQFPRAGVGEFLRFAVDRFEVVVLFTTVREDIARGVLENLVGEGIVDGEVVEAIGYVEWSGTVKDLAFVEGAAVEEVLLVDDMEVVVHPEQKGQWVAVEPFVAPYGQDGELERVRQEIEARLAVSEEEEDGPVLFGPGRGGAGAASSNFYPSSIAGGGRRYGTVEHFFQASKARTEAEHDVVRRAGTPGKAKKLGRKVALRAGWEGMKVEVMRKGLLAKFRQHAELGELLLSTGEREIHEDAPRDSVWGWQEGRGQDLLGRLLVEVRETLREEGEGRGGSP